MCRPTIRRPPMAPGPTRAIRHTPFRRRPATDSLLVLRPASLLAPASPLPVRCGAGAAPIGAPAASASTPTSSTASIVLPLAATPGSTTRCIDKGSPIAMRQRPNALVGEPRVRPPAGTTAALGQVVPVVQRAAQVASSRPAGRGGGQLAGRAGPNRPAAGQNRLAANRATGQGLQGRGSGQARSQALGQRANPGSSQFRGAAQRGNFAQQRSAFNPGNGAQARAFAQRGAASRQQFAGGFQRGGGGFQRASGGYQRPGGFQGGGGFQRGGGGGFQRGGGGGGGFRG